MVNYIKTIAKIIANLITLACIIYAMFCNNYAELSGIVMISIVVLLAIFAIDSYTKEEYMTKNVSSTLVLTFLFMLLVFIVAGKLRNAPEYVKTIETQKEVIQDYEQYYGAAETLLDSVGIISDSVIFETDAGIHYLHSKQLIDESCQN